MIRSARKSLRRVAAGWLSLTAVLLWAILPQGAMPVRAGAAGVVFALCTGEGPVLVELEADGSAHPVPRGNTGHDKEPCPFASVHMTAAVAGAPPAPAALASAEAVSWPRARAGLAVRPHLRPESRGPPYYS